MHGDGPAAHRRAGGQCHPGRLTITEPKVGASADFHPTLPSTASTQVSSVSWSNMDPSNPVFQQGQDYTDTTCTRGQIVTFLMRAVK